MFDHQPMILAFVIKLATDFRIDFMTSLVDSASWMYAPSTVCRDLLGEKKRLVYSTAIVVTHLSHRASHV
jgi:hypothetical protein